MRGAPAGALAGGEPRSACGCGTGSVSAPAWRIGNVDAFLYLRRRRPGSLTTDPATAFGSPLREHYRKLWRRDYAAVLAGTLFAGSQQPRRAPRPRVHRQ